LSCLASLQPTGQIARTERVAMQHLPRTSAWCRRHRRVQQESTAQRFA